MSSRNTIRNWIIVSLTTIASVLLTEVVSSSLLGNQVFSFASESFENEISDFYIRIARKARRNKKTSDLVRIVYIDQAQSRKEIASVIEKVASCNPRVIGLDIRFDQTGLKGDEELIRVLKDNQKKLVLSVTGSGTFNYNECTFESIKSSFFMDSLDTTNVGFDNLITEKGISVIRELLLSTVYNGTELNSFAYSIFNMCHGDSIRVERTHRLYYYPTYFYPVTDTCELLDKTNILADKMVLIGAKDDIDDLHVTPIGTLPGVDIHAQVLQGLIENRTITYIPKWVVWLISIIVALLFSCFLLSSKLHLSNYDNLLVRLTQLVSLVLLLALGAVLFVYFDVFLNFAPLFGVLVFGAFAFDVIFGLSSFVK